MKKKKRYVVKLLAILLMLAVGFGFIFCVKESWVKYILLLFIMLCALVIVTVDFLVMVTRDVKAGRKLFIQADDTVFCELRDNLKKEMGDTPRQIIEINRFYKRLSQELEENKKEKAKNTQTDDESKLKALIDRMNYLMAKKDLSEHIHTVVVSVMASLIVVLFSMVLMGVGFWDTFLSIILAIILMIWLIFYKYSNDIQFRDLYIIQYEMEKLNAMICEITDRIVVFENASRKNAEKIAKEMIRDGVSHEKVSSYTKLPVDIIEKMEND